MRRTSALANAAAGVELARDDGELGRQVLGLGSRRLELGVLVLAGGLDLRGLRSLGHLLRTDLRTLRPGRELGDEPLGAFGAIGELVQAGVALLDPAGQIDRAGLGGLGPSLGSAELRLERVGFRGRGLQRCPDRVELAPRLGELRFAILS